MPRHTVTFAKKTGALWLGILLFLNACQEDAPSIDMLMGEQGLLKDVLNIIHENYANPVKNDRIVQGALNGALQSLDEFCAYYSAKDFKTLTEILEGKFGGIGAEVKMMQEGFEVIAPVDGGPAYKGGIKAGDIITEINKEKIPDMTAIQALQKTHGEPGTTVTLKVLRKGCDPLEIKVKREIVTNVPIEAALDDRIAYIRLRLFNGQSAIELKKTKDSLIKELKEHLGKEATLQGLILDLRDNPGGTLDQAILVTSLFLDKGAIVHSIGRDPGERKTFNSTGPDIFKDVPIVVLINRGSASASEILAGALRDHKRAILMGGKSYGKGSMQRLFDLKEKGAVKLTIAYFQTPNNTIINGKGLEPDIRVDISKDTHSKTADSTGIKADIQRQRAVDLLRGLSALNRW